MATKFNSSSLTAFVDSGLPLLLLRAFTAAMLFYNHGLDKVIHVSSGNFPPNFDPIGLGTVVSFTLAAFAEGVCTIFIFVGFYTRLAALFLIINFIVAFYAASKELALLYLVDFLVIFLIGPGKLSLDSNSL